MGERAFNPNLIVPAGTEVVARIPVRTIGAEQTLPKGAVGVVVQSPTDNSHAYRVRFPDASEAMLKRQEVAVLKQVQRWGLERVGGVLEDYNLYDYVIYRCVLGSRAYGLAQDNSDTDLRGIYLPPAELHWSLYGVPGQLENEETEEAYWELQKFLTLALKANPNTRPAARDPPRRARMGRDQSLATRAAQGVRRRLRDDDFTGKAGLRPRGCIPDPRAAVDGQCALNNDEKR